MEYLGLDPDRLSCLDTGVSPGPAFGQARLSHQGRGKYWIPAYAGMTRSRSSASPQPASPTGGETSCFLRRKCSGCFYRCLYFR